jgi:hypothetical protein
MLDVIRAGLNTDLPDPLKTRPQRLSTSFLKLSAVRIAVVHVSTSTHKGFQSPASSHMTVPTGMRPAAAANGLKRWLCNVFPVMHLGRRSIVVWIVFGAKFPRDDRHIVIVPDNAEIECITDSIVSCYMEEVLVTK